MKNVFSSDNATEATLYKRFFRARNTSIYSTLFKRRIFAQPGFTRVIADQFMVNLVTLQKMTNWWMSLPINCNSLLLPTVANNIDSKPWVLQTVWSWKFSSFFFLGDGIIWRSDQLEHNLEPVQICSSKRMTVQPENLEPNSFRSCWVYWWRNCLRSLFRSKELFLIFVSEKVKKFTIWIRWWTKRLRMQK